MLLDRKNTGFFSRWWWSIDRYFIYAVIAAIAVGAVLVMASSPSVATRIGVEPYYFIHRQVIFILLAISVMFLTSLCPEKLIKRLAIAGFTASILLLIAVLIFGMEIKGARRWLHIAGLVIQPSEFAKTFFIITAAWVLSRKFIKPDFKAFPIAIFLYLLLASLLIMQPDFGATVTTTMVFGSQIFIAGISWIWVILASIFSIVGIIAAYSMLPHVAARIDNFLGTGSGDNYQVSKSLEGFINGGVFGRGPGQGEIKKYLPDSHTDFIFSVAGEELGLIACLFIIGIFAFVVIHGFLTLAKHEDMFVILAVFGLLIQIGLQAIVNMSVALNLVPSTGMTLPFISYGGSSMLSAALAVGVILALTKRKYGIKNMISNLSKVKIWQISEIQTK